MQMMVIYYIHPTAFTYTVQSLHRTSIPDHLIISAANIQLAESIGQGMLEHASDRHQK